MKTKTTMIVQLLDTLEDTSGDDRTISTWTKMLNSYRKCSDQTLKQDDKDETSQLRTWSQSCSATSSTPIQIPSTNFKSIASANLSLEKYTCNIN